MNLIIEYFNPNNDERHQEYLDCLQKNIANDLIKNVHIFISDGSELDMACEKIVINRPVQRPTYYELFNYCNENLKEKTCIVANGDIIFTKDICFFNTISLDKVFIALTRWELVLHQQQWIPAPFKKGTSQDAWIFKAPILTCEEMNFNLGKPGCDNKIVKLVYDLGYEIRNPGNGLVTIHNHRSQFRTYTEKERVPGPYLLVFPNQDITKKARLLEIPGFFES
ncbi:hypothetical protein [Methylomonas sp. ZR1]|uniref:hypothetical protein n=1 Tax=Methylomonas sp. ZR1 TaxID=1797072 RepID=UPI001490FCE5|nr:hypothetical protein [Methylomonas sp. ZR1]NOV29366.1 hypothetical protein [Methylomonas sp. ZR1]